MASYTDLKELIAKATSWEKQLKDLYDVAELGLQDTESKKLASVLRDKLVRKLEVLEHIDTDKFGKTEWMKFAPDYKDEDIIPKNAISCPFRIFDLNMGPRPVS